MGSLRYLNVEKTGATDIDLLALSRLPRLTDLDPGYNPLVTDAGLAKVHGLPKLATLRLYETCVTDAGVKGLKKAMPGVRVEK